MAVHADPNDMERFANHVVSFGTSMADGIQALRQDFESLDWNDAQRQRFADLVEEHSGRLKALVDVVGQIAPEIRVKIAPLREYLGM